MREPDFELDGWCLDDGETRHREAPERFWIPETERRNALQPGDLAKLIFRIAVDSEDEPVAVERMWVIVRERTGHLYFGTLDNDPCAITENDELWSGIEVPFEARHVVDINPADEASRAKALEVPRRKWSSEG